MISTSFILSTGLKKWMPMNFPGRALAWARPVIGRVEGLLAKKPPGAGCGEAGGGEGRGVAGEKTAGCELRLGRARDLGLERAVLEHGFDDQFAAGQVAH